jgi:isoquinoline 1-oxidoreductase beta subunit
MNEILSKTSRRAFLQGAGAAGAGLVLAMHLPLNARAQSGAAIAFRPTEAAAGSFEPNAFVRLAPDNTVTVLIKHLEMGQGPYTGLSTLVAEELDADWSLMRAEGAPADTALYKNFAFDMQGTGGSTAIANSYDQMRMAGATARAMLVAAAAEEWGVPAAEIETRKSVLSHAASGKSAPYGDFAAKAAAVPVPKDVKLKDPKDFTLIGTDVPKLDSRAKTTGKAHFTIDEMREGMLTVLIRRPDRFGGKVKSVDDAAARAVKGVVDVKTIPQGVAVYAEGYWAAKKGRDALGVEWDDSAAERRSTPEMFAYYAKLAEAHGMPAGASRGDAEAGIKGAAKTIAADYRFPYLAHAAMETLDCAIEWRDDGVEAWYGCQFPSIDQGVIAKVFGVDPKQVKINVLLAGGSFGRRAQPDAHVAAEAAEAAKAIGKNRAVKLIYSREDDMKAGYYRPAFFHRMRAGLDEAGKIVGWEHILVGQSIFAGGPLAPMIEGGVDPTSVEGAADFEYELADVKVSLHTADIGVPVLWWRSVGHTHTNYAVETFLDRLFMESGTDPVEGRLALLTKHPRHTGVLKAVAEMSNWGGPVPEARARGVSVVKSFNSYVAEVVEVSVGPEGLPKVHKVWCAVDCGIVVNPNVVTAQMEGGIGFGLGAILHDQITLTDGVVDQGNFDDYRSLRIDEMPEVEVRIIESTEKPTGVGEPGVPPVGPALASAWAKLTGEWVTELPFKPGPGV